MHQEEFDGLQGLACGEFETKLTLLAADELETSEAEVIRRHVQGCEGCRTALQQETELLALMSSDRSEVDPNFLASCRAGLFDTLDQQEEKGWLRRITGSFLPASWISPDPAWSAALLLVIGFSVGLFGPRLLRHAPSGVKTASNPAGIITAVEPTDANRFESDPVSPISSIDLHTAQVAGINVFPASGDAPPQVQLRMNTQQPMMVSGTVENDNVKQVLIHVLQDSQRYDPDVRLDAVELLRTRNNDADVRSALCHAVHTDHNAAVRLKALEALDGAEPQSLVRQTLLDALVDDQNPGVRVEAINELRDLAAKGQINSDDELLKVLHERIKKDPSTYIRLQSAAVIRDLGPRQKF
jgi:Putative zinc-finger